MPNFFFKNNFNITQCNVFATISYSFIHNENKIILTDNYAYFV